MVEDEELDEATKRILDRTRNIRFTGDDAKRNHGEKRVQKKVQEKEIFKPVTKWDEDEAFYKEIEDLAAEDAIIKLQNALKDDFDNVDLWIKLGEKQYYIRKDKDAIHSFQTALIKEPENKVSLKKLAWCFEELGQWSDAKECYKKIISLDDKNEIALSGYAYCSLKLSEYDASIEYYSKVLEINKNDSVALDNIGFTYFLQKKYDEAIKWFERATHVERDSDDDYAERFLARTKWMLKNDDECEKNVDKLIENETKDFHIYYLKSELLLTKEKYDEAIAFCKKSIQLNENEDNVFCLGLCYQKKENYEFAILYYEQILKRFDGGKEKENLLINLAYCYKNLSNLKKALMLCDEALDSDPGYLRALFCKIKCYQELDELENVINTVINFEKMTGKNVTDIETLVELIDVSIDLKQIDQGLVYVDRLEQVAETDEEKIIAQIWKGYALKHNKQNDESLAIYDKIIEENPDREDTYRLKADILDAMGRFDEAIENYRISIRLNNKKDGKGKTIGNTHLDIAKIMKSQGNVLTETLGYDHEERKKKMQEAIEELEIAEGILIDSWEVQYQKGNCYWNIRNYPKALQSYEMAINKDPDRIETWVCLADTSSMLGATTEARMFYEKASKIGSDKVQGVLAEGRSQRNDWVDAKLGLIRCLYNEKKYEDALIEIEKIIVISSVRGDDGAYRYKAMCLGEIGKRTEAISVWEECVKKFPDDKSLKGISLYNRSLDANNLGLEKDADEYAKKLIDSDTPIAADGYQLQGKYLRERKLYKEAIEILEEHLADFSKHGKKQALETIISCYDQIGNKEKKEEYKKRLKELEEED
tara:strand:+ start:866 stop:3334 length:2469 start_codon:yes stop_codon:yes gene_type:complete